MQQVGDAPAVEAVQQRGKGRLVIGVAPGQDEQIPHQIFRIILPWLDPLNSRMKAE